MGGAGAMRDTPCTPSDRVSGMMITVWRGCPDGADPDTTGEEEDEEEEEDSFWEWESESMDVDVNGTSFVSTKTTLRLLTTLRVDGFQHL